MIIEDEVPFLHRQPLDGDGEVRGSGEARCVGAGVVINPSIPVIDGETGEGSGVVPPWCVVINATVPSGCPAARSDFRAP